MRIFILDDDEVRHTVLAKRYPDADRVHTYNYHDAVEAWAKGPFDVVFLDHDLGQDSVVYDPYPLELSGDHFAHFITHSEPSLRPYQVVVHSHNPIGARNIVNRLRDAGFKVDYVPFKA